MEILQVLMLTILDFGGVLYNIEFERTRRALMQLPGYNGAPVSFGVDVQSDVFVDFDKGLRSTEAFRAELRALWGFTCTDAELDAAWCAILLGQYPHAQAAVQYHREHGPVALLSNISVLHFEHCLPECEELLASFDACFYSFAMHLRKPDPAAFLHVCDAMGYDPAETILYDDSAANCAAAAALGMQKVRVLTSADLLPSSRGHTTT
jgi:putative hydrolase of the HAD superfamily